MIIALVSFSYVDDLQNLEKCLRHCLRRQIGLQQLNPTRINVKNIRQDWLRPLLKDFFWGFYFRVYLFFGNKLIFQNIYNSKGSLQQLQH